MPEGFTPHGRVTVVIRPEHATIVKNRSAATVGAIVENIVYFGTDTHYHLKLGGGGEFIVRHQNRRAGEGGFARGMEVGLRFEDGAARVLRD